MFSQLLMPVCKTPRAFLLSGLILLCLGSAATALEKDFAKQRERLAQTIEREVRLTRSYLGKSGLDQSVLQALRRVPRHEFVTQDHKTQAYKNRPLPIGYGQTISQPYIVAIMTDLLQVESDDIVFELGTGSGYQAAVLAELVQHVYTMEIIEPLGERARETMARLGYDNVTIEIGDGYFGWKEHAPFDAIVVTAAGDHIPPPLIQQLKPEGRMIIPVGSRFMTQQLVLIEKQKDGTIRSREILPVRFVPITGGH